MVDNRMDKWQSTQWSPHLFMPAVLSLVLGTVVYLFDRAPETVYFMPALLSLSETKSHLFGVLGQNLPTLTHVFAFALLTYALCRPSRVVACLSCIGWFAIEALFEIAQYHPIAIRIAEIIPAWFQSVPVLDNTAAYFMRGTFDPNDLLSIALGAAAAYFTITVMRRKEDEF